jgi:signal transduction histidine kinase
LQLKRVSSLTTWSTWLLGVAMVSLAVIGTAQGLRSQRSFAQEERDRLRAEISSALDLWQERVTWNLSVWFSRMNREGDMAAQEAAFRREQPYFDAFYVWDLTTHDILYPVGSSEAEGLLPDSACIRQVEADDAFLPPAVTARRYLGCLLDWRPAPPGWEVLITERAARLYLDAQMPGVALRALGKGQVPITYPFADAPALGLSIEALAERRFLAAEAYDVGGYSARAKRIVFDIGYELADLDGPLIGETLSDISPLVYDKLFGLGAETETADLDALFERALRREEAWTEVRDRVSLRVSPPSASALPRVVRDQYGTPPYVLVYRQLAVAGLVGAIQIDEPLLVEHFLSLLGTDLRNHVVIVDSTGRSVAGFGSVTDVPVFVPMPAPFGYLRAGLSETAVAVATTAARNRLLAQMGLVVAAVLLGALAFGARFTADRRQRALYQRQRDFVTRVTHELKTPLAGIRVMAEAIEMGAFGNDQERQDLAVRIGLESERLGARVEEVLRVAREPTDFHPEVVEPAQLAEEVAGQWEHFMDREEVDFQMDFQETEPLLCETGILRDALAALLDNALKYRRPGSGSRILFNVRSEGTRWVVFEVVDNGIGVPPAHRKEIFEPFRRVEGPGRGKAGGHGLGLSFVADAARIHGGRAECHEGIDGGAAFLLRIPFKAFRPHWWRRVAPVA